MWLGLVLAIVAMVFIVPMELVSAHPGNTASDGGHYCWSNCASWGEVYGERHFHGGSSGPTTYSAPPEPDYDEPDYTDYSDDYSSGSSSANTTTPDDPTTRTNIETPPATTEPTTKISGTNTGYPLVEFTAAIVLISGTTAAVMYRKEIAAWTKKNF